MATFSLAILDGHLDPMSVARDLVSLYGARHMRIELTSNDPNSFDLVFEEALKPADAGKRPHQRKGLTRRMSLHTNGFCMADHADLTTEPATMLVLGWGVGDEDLIFETLARHHGGWTRRYDDDAWQRYDYVRVAA